jgi:phytoene dehydrogenase-like protein
MVKGGPGELTRAMADAARQAGAEIRTSAAVSRVTVRDGRVTGVRLEDGTELAAAASSPMLTRNIRSSSSSARSISSRPLTRIRNYRCPGTSAKINLALGALPAFRGVGSRADLAGRIQIGPGSIISNERSTPEVWRHLARTLLGHYVSHPSRSIARAVSGQVMSVRAVRALTLAKGRPWSEARAELAASVRGVLEQYAPGIERLIVHEQVITPEISNRPTASLVATSSTASPRSISCSRCDRFWDGLGIVRRSTACICAAPALIPAEA